MNYMKQGQFKNQKHLHNMEVCYREGFLFEIDNFKEHEFRGVIVASSKLICRSARINERTDDAWVELWMRWAHLLLDGEVV